MLQEVLVYRALQVLMGGQDGKSQKVKEEIQATLVSEACPDRQVPMEWTLYQGWWEKGADLVSPDNQVSRDQRVSWEIVGLQDPLA